MTDQDDKKQIRKRDGEFLTRTAIYVLLIMGIFYAFEPYLGPRRPPPDEKAIAELSTQIISLAPKDIAKKIAVSKKPAVLMVYASWCSYCNVMMPSVKRLWSDKKFEGKQLIFVSLDTGVYPLARYVLANDLLAMTGTPILLKTAVTPSLPELLRSMGANFTGGIPYMGFFAAGGKPVAELHGFVFKSAIENALVALEPQ